MASAAAAAAAHVPQVPLRPAHGLVLPTLVLGTLVAPVVTAAPTSVMEAACAHSQARSLAAVGCLAAVSWGSRAATFVSVSAWCV